MKYKLNQNQINQIQLEENPFFKRDIIQDIGIDIFKKTDFKMIAMWATSVGKTIFVCKIMKRIQTKHPDKKMHVCVPTETLQLQWLAKIEEFGIKNTEVYIINTYLKKNFEVEELPYFLAVDECHIGVSNPDTKAAAINDFDIRCKLYLSATLKNEQIRYLASKGIINNFEITLKEALLLGLVPEFSIYNVYVDLEDKEKERLEKVYEKYTEYLDFFENHGYKNLPKQEPYIEGVDPKMVKIMYYQAQGKRASIISIINNAANKIRAVRDLLPVLEKRKTILFSKNIATAKKLASLDKTMSIYHSQQTGASGNRNLEAFKNNETNCISSVGKLIAGFDDESTDSLIRHSFDSTAHSGIQSIGRLLRIDPNNPDKYPIIINLICRPFNGITPNDNFWINISLKGLNQEWIELPDLITLLTKKFNEGQSN